MKLKCPDCGNRLPTSQMNVEADVAVCTDCDLTFSISDLVEKEKSFTESGGILSDKSRRDFDIDQPPPGASFERSGTGWKLTVSTRSLYALVFIPFVAGWFWFVYAAMYASQIESGEFDLQRSLFGLPFVLIGLMFVGTAILYVAGHTSIRKDELDSDLGIVFLGVGPIGLTSRFRWTEVTGIDEARSRSRKGRGSPYLALRRDEGDISFGTLLSKRRRRYVLYAVRQLLNESHQ